MEFWEQFVGRVMDGWELDRVLSAHGPIAVFAVRREGGTEQGAMKVLLLQPAAIDHQLRQWEMAAYLSHPNLMRVLGRGQADFEGASSAYIVTELADDNLSTVLHNRALTEKETGEVLEPVLAAVAYLHSKGVVHGRIRPSNVLAVADDVKLSSDSLLPEGQSPVFSRERDAHDAPGSATGVPPRPADDVWSLGALISEALPQRTGTYAEIVTHTLEDDPEKRWSLAQVRDRLRGPAALSVPLPEHFKRSLSEPEPLGKSNLKYASIAGAAVLVLLVVFLFARKPHEPAPAALIPEAAVPAAATPINPPTPRRPGLPENIARRKSGDRWFVVVATYGRRRDAEKRANKMSRKWPRFRVRVYEPPVEKPHHLVVIGENLSREAALDLQHRARLAGMPRDVYVKQFAGG